MKIALAIFIPLAALALFVTFWDLRPAYRHTDRDWAKGCNTSVSDFRSARAEAMSNTARPKVVVGRCSLQKANAGGLNLDVLEPGQVVTNAQAH
ncbi:hypothetical protein [uncultured Sphingomonas sp.]|uniref:hypothetical protein n=1 Tax=uncultured Sphingomonas sp. TaxID=158754 RepID=UPI0025E3CFF0|nr:hypothetical protein [uncultured Sphingomonas sp.]